MTPPIEYTTEKSKSPSNQVARWAILAIFFIHGLVFANWFARIPDIQANLNLSEGEFGLILVGGSVGIMGALAMAGGLVARFGSKQVTAIASYVFIISLPIIALATNAFMLFFGLLWLGMAAGMMDVSMNAQAVEVERRYERPLMSSFHAAFSAGGFVGAILGSILIGLNWSVLLHFTVIPFLMILATAYAIRYCVYVEGEQTSGGSTFSLPKRALIPLGLIAFCASIGEGAMSDWTGIYLRDIALADATIVTWGYGAFSLTMMLGRWAGDWLVGRFSNTAIVRAGAILAGVGTLLSIVIPTPAMSIIGFALVGAGLANVIPLAFSMAGKQPNIQVGEGIAGVATIGYMGFLAGPLIIGAVADLFNLQVSFILIVVLMLVMLFFGSAIQPKAKN